MTQFYVVRDSDRRLVWLAALSDGRRPGMYVYLANDQLWHLNAGLEDEFYDRDRELEFVPTTAETAAAVLERIEPVNATTAKWLVNELQASDWTTNHDLGITPLPRIQSTTRKEVQSRIKHGEWTAIHTSPSPEAARKFLSDIRRGRKKALNRLGDVEARLDGTTILVRLTKSGKRSFPNKGELRRTEKVNYGGKSKFTNR